MCCVFRNLVLDDDLRSEFSKAHEHARLIAKDVLVDLTKLLAGNGTYLLSIYFIARSFWMNHACDCVPNIDKMDNQILFSDLLLTLAAIAVRQEFCKDIEIAGGLQYIYDGMVSIAYRFYVP